MNKLAYIVLTLSLSACASIQKPKSTSTTEDTRLRLVERVTQVRSWAPMCEGRASKVDCDEGDMALFGGLLCLTGEAIACDAVKASQGADGRFWRAPSRVDNQSQNSFSRDMLIGVLAYYVKTKDVQSALEFQGYLEAHDWTLCPDSVDARCSITPGMYGLMKLVWQDLGLEPTQDMLVGNAGDESTLYAQAVGSHVGFELHLVASNLLIRRKLGKWTEKLQATSEMLATRQPDNPLFVFLAEGSTDRAVELILNQAPSEPPAKPFQWSVERDTASQAWKDSMGWEFVALINLILQEK